MDSAWDFFARFWRKIIQSSVCIHTEYMAEQRIWQVTVYAWGGGGGYRYRYIRSYTRSLAVSYWRIILGIHATFSQHIRSIIYQGRAEGWMGMVYGGSSGRPPSSPGQASSISKNCPHLIFSDTACSVLCFFFQDETDRYILTLFCC